MNLRSLPTRIFLLLSMLAALAFAGDRQSFNFYLTTNKIYSPGDPDVSVELSGNNLPSGPVKFRAFRVENPVEFFMTQKDPHSPTLANLVGPNTFDMIRMGYDKVKRDVRYAARDVMPAGARRAIRDVTDLNGTKGAKKAEEPKKKAPTDGKDIPKGAEGYEVVGEWTYPLKTSDDNWQYESVPVPLREKGVYLIEARIGGRRAITALVISQFGVVVKQTNTGLLSFIADKKTGQKVGGVPLTFVRGGEKFTEGETNSDGILTVEVPPLQEARSGDEEESEDDIDWYWEYRRRQIYIFGEKDGNFVISDPYSYGGDNEGNYRIYTQTDRPVYRPAQTVYYRGVIRRVNDDGTYANVTDSTIYVEIQDARNGVVRRDTLRLSDMGVYSGQVELADEAPLGYYSIRTTIGQRNYWINFSVEEYKKPEYKVTVTADKEQYTRGDEIHATVRADYFFGSPVANAAVEYFVYRARYWRPWWRGSEWAYLYEDRDDFYTYRMEMVESDTGTIGSDGTFDITYHSDSDAEFDYVYRIQANVVDNSRRSISGAKSVEVTRGEFYISANTDKYVYAVGDDATINVEITTFEGEKPVATRFDANVTRVWWDKIFVDSVDGVADYRYERRSRTIWSGSGTTGPDGKGSVIYKADTAGYLEATVTAVDSRGTSIGEKTYIYASDRSYANWYHEGSGDVQIVPDKDSYTPGETMNALVIMPAAGIDALITTEATTIYTQRVERLDATSAIVHIPIEERYAPMFYVSAAALINDQLYSESQRVTVVPKGKLIRLEVTTDKQIYKPGQKGSVTVRAVDESGSPVENVDVAVGMVDEAIYSIQPDATPDIQRYFYGARWNEVYTSASLDFGFYGSGTGTRIDNERDPLFGARATGRGSFTDRGRKNIAYGDIKGQMFVQPTTRRKFKDLMFWTPSVRTGSDGRANMNVEFPDNLTTWRITARGITRNTAVGQTVARVVSRKDLLVRMETPRFMTEGDVMSIATTVHNYLSSAKTTKVEFAGEHVEVSGREQTITIPANGEQRIDWKLTAPSSVPADGAAKLTVRALTDEESDALELTVPILPRGMIGATGERTDIGEENGQRTIDLALPNGTDPSTSNLYVTLSPSLAGSILGSLDQLIGYPYGCVEQTMSRFLPTVVVADAMKQFDLSLDEKKTAEIPKMVNKGLARLYAMQGENGGWGWWNGDDDPFMTAYVMYGLTIARRTGYFVLEDRYDAGARALRKMIDAERTEKDKQRSWTTQSYLLYVATVVEGTNQQPALVERIKSLARIDSLNSYSVALLSLAAGNQGEKALTEKLAQTLESRATTDETGSFWQSRGRQFFWQNDIVETSAFAVKAIMGARGETDLVKRGVRWLLSRKGENGWHNTRQTAMVIYALTDYLKNTQELNPDYDVIVRVNGEEAYRTHIDRKDLFKEEKNLPVKGAMLRSGKNSVTVEKSGRGQLQAAARLVYRVTGSEIRPASAGFKVSRQYYLLTKERKGDVYVYKKSPFTGTVRTGDELLVTVRVVPDIGYDYVMVEDPLPAGCEVVRDTKGYVIPGESEYSETSNFNGWDDYGWYDNREIRDEKVAFFAQFVSPEMHQFTYILRAQIPGTYAVMPSIGSLMYYPEVRGNSAPLTISITE